jgi:putative transposase
MAEKNKRRRRNGAQWAALMEAHAQSGLSQRAFCEAQDLSLSAFTRALGKVGVDAQNEGPRLSAAFVPVTVDAASSGHWELELQLGPSVVMRVRGS